MSHGPFCNPFVVSGPPNGQFAAVAHARPSSHCMRGVPAQCSLAQSSSLAHGWPVVRACWLGAHTYGVGATPGYPGPHVSPFVQPLASRHVEHAP